MYKNFYMSVYKVMQMNRQLEFVNMKKKNEKHLDCLQGTHLLLCECQVQVWSCGLWCGFRL